MAATVKVLRPGLFTTVQDTGRWGWQSLGVPVSGAMDLVSHRLANSLVGNPPSCATLEVTLVGPELEFEDERMLAIVGADFEVEIDGVRAATYASVRVGPGSRCRFGARRKGARAYVAVSGGIAVRDVLGSRSTHVPTKLGGYDGRPLAAGDRLPLGQRGRFGVADRAAAERAMALARLPGAGATSLRVLSGPHADRLGPRALSILQAEQYVVTKDSNRMGYRLDGLALPSTPEALILSEATLSGALQVPPDGQPILLTADRQTTGGYPILAAVITADLGLAGQLSPGDTVRFTQCSHADAAAAVVAQERLLMAAESAGAE
jgi:antagonist of KipI